jgi:hypothetical protein
VQQQSGQLQEASNELAKDLKDVHEVVLAMADMRQRMQLLESKGDANASEVNDLREELFEVKGNLQPRTRKTVCFSAMNESTRSAAPSGNAAVADASQQIEGIMKRLDDIQSASSDVLREVGTSIGVLRDEVNHSQANGCDPALHSKMMEGIADLRLQLTQFLELSMGSRSNTGAAMVAGSSFEVSMVLPATAEPAAQAAGEDIECEEEADVQMVHDILREHVAPLARDIASLQQGHAYLERAVAASNVLAAGSALVESMQEQF